MFIDKMSHRRLKEQLNSEKFQVTTFGGRVRKLEKIIL